MTGLIAAIFLASVLGGLHCAGMCGAFMAFAVTPGEQPVSRAAAQGAYHLGRLVTYVMLGSIAGAVGSAVDLGASGAGLQRGAAALAGTMMVVFGGAAVLRVMGVRLPRVGVPVAMQRLALAGHRAAFELPPLVRAGATGLLTTLLPCGWLYAFVIAAAGTGSAGWGAAAMVVFWLGTLPWMIAVGAGIQGVAGPLKRHLPLVTSVAVVVMGVWTVAGRMSGRGGHALPASAMLLESGEGGPAVECGP